MGINLILPKKLLIIVFLFLLLVSLLSCRLTGGAVSPPAGASESLTPPMETATDIAYISAVDPLQTLDIYRPSEDTASLNPVMIYVHGGSWTVGDKRRVELKDDFFTQQGWLFISVNYRLSPQVNWREMAGDVAAAVAWVHANIAEYGGDPEKIFLMGHSAGAHLVSLVGTDEIYLGNEGLDLSVIKGVLSLDTRAYNIPSLAQSDGKLPRAYAPVFGDDPQEWRAASPLYHIAPDKGIPPFVIAWSKGVAGNWEGDKREAAAKAFGEALESAGVEVLLVDGSDKTHSEINQQFGGEGDSVTLQAMQFLNALAGIDSE